MRASRRAFTLIEMLTVIAIIAVLVSLLSSALGVARDSARRTQAKQDLLQMVAAAQSYYVDYGIYPIKPQAAGEGTEVTFTTDNSDVFYTLTATADGVNSNNFLNPRQTIYLDIPQVQDSGHPRRGLSRGIWYDPWGPQPGKPESGIYHLRFDGAYSNTVSDPYPGSAGTNGGSSSGSSGGWGSGGVTSSGPSGGAGGPATIHAGIIAWSLAKTGVQTYDLQDQVLSWK